MDGTKALFIYVHPGLIDTLSASSCQGVQGPSSAPMPCAPQPSFMLEVRVLHRKMTAEMLCTEWKCPNNTKQVHSKWITNIAFEKHFKPFMCTFRPEITANVQATPTCKQRWPLRVYSTPNMGRMAVATTSMPLGTRVFETPAFAAVVSDKYRQRYCHFCIQRLTRKAFQCDQCRFSVYCSMECLTTDATTFHELQCEVLIRLKAERDCDTELLRLVIAVLSMQHCLALKPGNNPLQDLLVPPVVENTGQKYKEQLLKLLRGSKLSHFVSPTQAHDVLLKVRSNAHPLVLNGSVTCGLGLFPEAAMVFNHSCSPNIILAFQPGTRMLRAHSIRPIQPRQALEYAYIDLLPSKSRRRQLLNDAFAFDCSCLRCYEEGKLERMGQDLHDQETAQLLQLQKATASPSQFDVNKIFKRYTYGQRPSAELLFSLWMVQMNASIQKHEWQQARKVIKQMIKAWTMEWELPQYHPVMDALYRHLLRVSIHLDLTLKTEKIRSKIDQIGAICGFSE
uniref:SET and MYND domain containing 2 putative n=1 Tax=Albugo laibachii Nc14 TaxID=890382 RepID=F0WM04_9STRA|nr:SET and MYND domain containing 2 putative [Albugo laibachii Nc14]|eukprot:CCA22331.1 SET and MYND domain containing 2 putative [Albugo laibachii Nc14]